LSIGAAVSMPEDTLDDIFGQADDALYAAKRPGARVWSSGKAPPAWLWQPKAPYWAAQDNSVSTKRTSSVHPASKTPLCVQTNDSAL